MPESVSKSPNQTPQRLSRNSIYLQSFFKKTVTFSLNFLNENFIDILVTANFSDVKQLKWGDVKLIYKSNLGAIEKTTDLLASYLKYPKSMKDLYSTN